MFAAVRGAAVLGIGTHEVTAELDVNSGLPNWTVESKSVGCAARSSAARVSTSPLRPVLEPGLPRRDDCHF
jgi:hypothetical protein